MIHNPLNTFMSLGNLEIEDFQDDTMATIERFGESSVQSGAKGNNVLSVNPNRGALVSFNLSQNGQGYALMMQYIREDRANGTPIARPFFIRNEDNGYQGSGMARIHTRGVESFAATASGRTFTLFLDVLEDD